MKISSNPIFSSETCYSKKFNLFEALPILAELNFQWLCFYLSAIIGRKLCVLYAVLLFFFIKEKKRPAITIPLILLLPDIGLVLCKATEWVKEHLFSSFCEICHTAANCFSQYALHRACFAFMYRQNHNVLQIYFYKVDVKLSWGVEYWVNILTSNMIIEMT